MKAAQMAIDLGPLFPIRIHVGFKNINAFEEYINADLTEEATKKHMKGIRKYEKRASGLYNYQYRGSFTIFIYDNEDKPGVHLDEVIAHEVFHMTMNIGKYLGIKYCSKSEEFFAYVNGYINSIIFSNRYLYEDDPDSSKEEAVLDKVITIQNIDREGFIQNTTDV